MSKAILLGTLTADGTLTHSNQGFFGKRFSALVSGSFGSPAGTLTIEAGIPGTTERIKVLDPATGGFSEVMLINSVGLYTFEANCESLEFILAGATSPSLAINLFPENRP